MKNYEITVSYTRYATYFIEAENEQQAKDKVWGMYDPDDAESCDGSNIDSIEEVTA
jgi:hypothetical protein